jgi:hypothetical protein
MENETEVKTETVEEPKIPEVVQLHHVGGLLQWLHERILVLEGKKTNEEIDFTPPAS